MSDNLELAAKLRDQRFQYSGPQPDALNAAAAPDVCEWTRVFDSHANRKWRERGCDGSVSHWDDVCPNCGKPIRIVEAAHEY